MLQRIREKSHGWFAWVLFSLISMTFLLWGIHSYTDNTVTNIVATVNSSDISQNDLHSAYERLRIQRQFQSGLTSLSPEIEKQLKQAALQELIINDLLAHSAKTLGLRFTLEQAISNIHLMPAFQVNNNFSLEKFRTTLANLAYTENQFIKNLQSAMLINQLRVGFANSAFALPNEVTKALHLVKQQRDIRYLLIPVKSLSQKIKITASEIQKYYNEHQQDFESPEQVSVEYLTLQNSNHTEQSFADQNEKLANLTFSNPSSLAPAAKALNLTINKTDFFTRKSTAKSGILANPKIIATAFSDDVLKRKNNSNLIELDPQHTIVLRVKEHKPSIVQPLSQVYSLIMEKLKDKKSSEEASILAQRILQLLSAGKNIDSILQQYKLSWINKTKLNRYDNTVPGQILLKAFQLPPSYSKAYFPGIASLSNGNYAVIITTKVYESSLRDNPQEEKAFSEQLQHLYGQLDYGLYVDSVFKKAKITLKDII